MKRRQFVQGVAGVSATSFICGNSFAQSTSAELLGSSTALVSGSTRGTVSIPGGSSGDRQYLAINHTNASSVYVELSSEWSNVTASTADEHVGRLELFERVLSSDTETAGVSVGFSEPVSAVISAFTVRGSRGAVSLNTPSQSSFVRSVGVPAVSTSGTGSMVVSVVGSANWPRSFTPASDVSEVADAHLPSSLSIAVGAKSAGSGSQTLGNWTPLDPKNPSGDGGDAFRAISLAFSPLTTPAPAPAQSPVAAGVTGNSTAVLQSGTTVSVSVPGGVNGDRQYLAINHTNGGSVYIKLPPEWSSVGSSAVDDYLGRLQLFERIITGDEAPTAISVGFTGSVSAVIAAFGVRGARGSVSLNGATQSVFVRSVAVPSVGTASVGSLVVSVVGSANWARSFIPGSDVTEIVDNRISSSLSIAVGFKAVDAGQQTLGSWTPVDPNTPEGDGGDAFRAISIAFSPISTTAPSPGPAPSPSPPPAPTPSPPPAGAVPAPILALPTAAPADQFTTTSSWDGSNGNFIVRLPFIAESNAWNASGDSFSQRVGIGPPTGQTCSFQIEANFPDVAPNDDAIRSYPSYIAGQGGGWGDFYTGSGWSNVPIQVKNVNTAWMGWRGRSSSSTGKGHFAHDLRLTNSPVKTYGNRSPRPTDVITLEFMVVSDQFAGYGRHPGGRDPARYRGLVSVGGVNYHFYIQPGAITTLMVWIPVVMPAPNDIDLGAIIRWARQTRYNQLPNGPGSLFQRGRDASSTLFNGEEWFISDTVGVEVVSGYFNEVISTAYLRVNQSGDF